MISPGDTFIDDVTGRTMTITHLVARTHYEVAVYANHPDTGTILMFVSHNKIKTKEN